jgi:hypothetical protein
MNSLLLFPTFAKPSPPAPTNLRSVPAKRRGETREPQIAVGGFE